MLNHNLMWNKNAILYIITTFKTRCVYFKKKPRMHNYPLLICDNKNTKPSRNTSFDDMHVDAGNRTKQIYKLSCELESKNKSNEFVIIELSQRQTGNSNLLQYWISNWERQQNTLRCVSFSTNQNRPWQTS